MLTFFTSLVCLLSLGVIFSIRRSISRRVFPLHTRAISSATMSKRRWFRYYTPMIMMLASVLSMVGYYYILDKSVKLAAADFSYSIKPSGKETSDSETFDQKVTLSAKLKELIKSNSAETIANINFIYSDNTVVTTR